MRGKVAKRLRKEVYGKEKEEPIKTRSYVELFGGTQVSTDQRRAYTKAKKFYKELKRAGIIKGISG